MIRADALLKMIDAYPDLMYDVPESTNIGADRTWSLWCPFVFKDTKRTFFLSEDWAFCQRARQIGIPIYADIRFKLWHWSNENGYSIGL